MSVYKKIITGISAFVITLLVILFCLLFTAPGNQFLAYSANKMVDGLKININNGRFLYNDAFSVNYKSKGIEFNATQLKINLFWLQCNGLCIDNLSAKSIKLTLPPSKNNNEEASKPLEKITLAFNIAIKNVQIDEFVLNHSRADVTVKNFKLSGDANGSDLNIKSLTIPSVVAVIKEQNEEKTIKTASAPISSLPAIPNIEFISPLNIFVEQFNIARVQVEQADQQYIIENIDLQGNVEDANIELHTLSAQYQQWQLNTQVDTTLDKAMPIKGNISLKSNNESVNLLLAGDLSDLNINLTTDGQYPLKLNANANFRKENYPFDLNANIEQWDIQNQSNQLKIHNVTLSAQGNADNYQLTLNGNSQLADYPAAKLNVDIEGTLADAKINTFVLKAKDSSARLNGKVDWQKGVKASFNGKLSQLKAQYFTDSVSSDISGQFEGAFDSKADTWQLKMNNTKLTGSVNKVPVELASNFSINEKLKANIDSFYLQSGTNKLSLKGYVDDSWHVDGLASLNSDEDANVPFVANGKADLTLRGKRLAPSAKLSLTLDNFSFNDTTINDLSVKGNLDADNDWQTNLNINVGSAVIAQQEINSIKIDASGDKKDHQLVASIDAEKGIVDLELTGRLKNNEWNGELSNVTLSDRKLQFSNTEDIAIKVNTQNGNFDVSAHCWKSPNSELCIDTLAQTKTLGQFNAKLNNLSIKEFSHLFPDDISTSGTIAGDFAANWQSGKLKTFRTHLDSSQLMATLITDGERLTLPVEKLSLDAFSDSQKGKLDAKLESSVLGKISSHVNIDDIQKAQTLDGNINIEKILLADLQPFLNTIEQLKGIISGQIALAGTLKDPQLNGELNVEEINLKGEQLPVALEKSNINIAFNKTTATVKGQLNDTQGGHVKLDGDVDWQGEQPEVNVAVQGERFYVRAQQGVVFKVSPDLKIGLANRALKLAGQVTVPYGRIEIEELPEDAVKVSDDQIIVDRKSTPTEDVPFDYDIDLKLLLQNDVQIESFGLSSKVEGDMAIKMAQGEPILATGELNLINGTYLAFGQNLIIKTGQIGFSGSIEQPYLNIKAIRNPDNTADDVIAGVTLTGNVEQPKLKIFSEPAMDQAQALAYLLNGQPLGEGDSSSDAMLTQLLLSQGVSRSEGVVSKVGETFGLSDVSLSSSGTGDDTKVEISGYVAPSLQVRYSVGIFDSLSEVAVRYQLLSKLYIEITSGLAQNVDVLYKFNVD